MTDSCCYKFSKLVFRFSNYNFQIIKTIAIVAIFFNNALQAQTNCSLGDPVFVENFGSGSARLGPSLNQDPINNVHPNFRPAKLYKYEGFDHIGQEEYGLIKNGNDVGPSPGDSAFNDNFPDHTPDDVDGGSGYFYYGDAGDELNMFFAQKINGLCDGIQYELSAWFANTNRADFGPIDPNIKLIVGFTDSNDNSIGSIFENNTGTITSAEPRWKRGSLVFTVPPGTANIYFMLQNNISGRVGNDLGIDDIEVRPCGPEIDISDQLTNNVINGENVCITDINDRDIKLSANIPNNFVKQWEESTTPGVWTNIAGETSSTLNYSIKVNVVTPHAIRLKFAHNLANLLNTKCHFFTDEIIYNQTYATTVSSLEVCDDSNDGDGTNGIVQSINLESQTATILGLQSPSNYTVTYHLSANHAINGTGLLTSPHTNTASPNLQAIFVRVVNNKSGCVNTNLSFNVIVNTLPLTNPVLNMELCDNLDDGNNSNGIVQTFNLESQTATILGSQTASNFTVTYHLSAANAVSGTNALTSPHANTLNPNSQTIYVRVTNTVTGCFKPNLKFDLIVNNLPVANPVTDLETCDNLDDLDNTNGIIQTWDLESQTSTILGMQPASNYRATYHLSVSDAQSGNNALSSPYENLASPNSQTIYVRVENTITNCVNSFTTFNLIVHPLPVVNSSVVLIQCDDDDPSTLGFSSFNLTEANNKISANTINESFTYFLTQAAAISGDTSSSDYITNPTTFTNATVSSDTVWARVETPFGCAKATKIQLLVSTTVIPSNFLMTFNQCDDFLDINGNNTANNDDGDGISTFNFSNVNAAILNLIPSGQNPLPPRYYRNETDALAEINEITDISNYRNIGYPNSQFIYVRVDSDIVNDCLGLGAHILLNVETLPEFSIETHQMVCSSNPTFTVELDPIETNPLETFTYKWTYQDGSVLSSEPTLTVSETGTYTVTLTKTNGTGCVKSSNVFVSASDFATVTQDDITVVDLSDSNTISINTNNLGLGDYEFALDDEYSFYQDEPFFKNVKGGVHTIFIRDNGGCGTVSIQISVIDFPKFFTPNNDGYHDTWQILGVNNQLQPNTIIHIYDRYGKLLKQLAPTSNGWDGSFNGAMMSSDDYWFKVLLQDGRELMGHFALKR